ncbi:MAG: hypothetical protein CSA55_06045, partial [Ilumatobacter coccineus]
MSAISVHPIKVGSGWSVRMGSLSLRIDVRAVIVCSLLLAATVGVTLWALVVGDFPLSISQAVAAIIGDGESDAEFVVTTLRLPRALTAVMVGAALGMSGAIFQSIARNPLGSPDIVGFQQGAAFAAVLSILVISDDTWAIALGAVIGGVVTAVIVYALAWKRGLASSRLILVGIGVGFTASAGVDYLITRAAINDVQRAAVWLTGSLNGRNWSHVYTVALALVILAPLAIIGQRSLDRLDLGDDTAAGLGIRVDRSKFRLIIIAVGLAALAVAAAGPIAFVAFVAGPIA